MKKTRIVLVDDHQLFIDGLNTILKEETNYEVVGTANGSSELFELLKTVPVDMVTLDIHMPQNDGIEVANELRRLHPHMKILIVSMYSHISQIKKLLRIGIQGFVMKESGKKELQSALAAIYNGNQYFSPEITRTLTDSLSSKVKRSGIHQVHLTKREYEVLQLVAQGLTTSAISEKLFVASTTINTHRKNIMEKLEVKNVAELIRYTTEMGLLE